MKTTNNVEVRPTPVTIGGCQWPVLFTFQAWWELQRRYGSIQAVLQAGSKGGQTMAAAFLWAGLLHSDPSVTEEDIRDLLNEATVVELMQLPKDLMAALLRSLPDRSEKTLDGGGEPWDWDVAKAVWATEWSQDPDRFWQSTFREFHSLSNGRAKLYESARQKRGDGGSGQVQPPAEGYTLLDMLTWRRR